MTVGFDKVTEISVQSSPDYLPRLRKILSCLADSVGMDSQEIQDTKLAFNEACTNAIRHGSPQGQENSIQIKLLTKSHFIVTEITDEGGGFDPTELPIRDASKPGGLGIPLMHALADNVEFEKNGQGMTVRLTKLAKNRRRRIKRSS